MKKITDRQAQYLLRLINQTYGTSYRYLSQVREDGIGQRMNKVVGISMQEASSLIDRYTALAKRRGN